MLAAMLPRMSIVALLSMVAVPACAPHSAGSQGEEIHRVDVHVSGYPGTRDPDGRIRLDTLSFAIFVNGVQILDTTLVPVMNVTGHVHSLAVRVAPGNHEFRVIDRRTSTMHDGRLRTRAGPMWVRVEFANEGAAIATGYGFLEFM